MGTWVSFYYSILIFFGLAHTTAFAQNQECHPIQSLKSIYGAKFQAPVAKVKVGVIGSGIDYNHPLLARFLAARYLFETPLQKIEAAPQAQNLTLCQLQRLQQNHQIGFPIWMDQALDSAWPMDQVIKEGVIQNKEHETRVASRIIFERENISLYFARRMYGKPTQDFDVEEVMSHFAKQGVQVVNMSFASPCGLLPHEEQAWERVFKRYSNIIFVVAAGNSGQNLDYAKACPAVFSRNNANVISVTSAAPDDSISIHYTIDLGEEIVVNYGLSVDVAAYADNLPVAVPYRYEEGWINHEVGWTSHATAEVSRILAHAIADGYIVDPATVKEQLIHTSRKARGLEGFVKSGGVVNEAAFRTELEFSTPAFGVQ